MILHCLNAIVFIPMLLCNISNYEIISLVLLVGALYKQHQLSGN